MVANGAIVGGDVDITDPNYIIAAQWPPLYATKFKEIGVRKFKSLEEMHAHAASPTRNNPFRTCIYPKYAMTSTRPQMYRSSLDNGMTTRAFTSLGEMHAFAKSVSATPSVVSTPSIVQFTMYPEYTATNSVPTEYCTSFDGRTRSSFLSLEKMHAAGDAHNRRQSWMPWLWSLFGIQT